MITILINNLPVQIGSELPDVVNQLEVRISPLGILQVPKLQTPAIKQWIKLLISRLECDYITYNGTLIPVSELKEK